MSALNIATRALTTNQAVMQVIGHNIANANTDGYTRQRVELQAVPGQQLGGGYFGKGVQIEAVTRVGYDAFLTRESNSTKATAAADAIRYQYLQNVESLFPMGAGGLGEILNNALNAWVDVANSPNDSTARQVVLNQFDALAARIRDTYARTQQIGESARLQASETSKEVNRIAQAIATVNDAIARVQGSGAAPNDLLDQRDRLVAQLNEKVQVTTLQADDGTLSVFVAGSLPLVLGSQASQLQVARADVDGDRQIKLQFVQGSSTYDVPVEFLGGGQLKGLVDFINRDLIQTQAELGRVALAMATRINQQQISGLSLINRRTEQIFTVADLDGLPIAGATGTSSAIVVDATKLPATDFVVSFQSGGVTVQRPSDGLYLQADGRWDSTTVSLPNTTVGVGQALGLTFNYTGPIAPATLPESFYFRPGADAAQSLQMIMNRPDSLAAANRISLSQRLSNLGNVAIEGYFARITGGDGSSFDASLVSPSVPPSLQYDLATNTFSITPATAATQFSTSMATYTPGQPMKFVFDDGTDTVEIYVTLRGQPNDDDLFDIAATPSNGLAFNSGNAQAILGLRDSIMFDGSITLSDGYVSVFSGLASRVNEAQTRSTFSKAQADDAEQRRANQAGVNLDEEAARLLQFQQAYQASAKYLQTVQSIFDTLIATFR